MELTSTLMDSSGFISEANLVQRQFPNSICTRKTTDALPAVYLDVLTRYIISNPPHPK